MTLHRLGLRADIEQLATDLAAVSASVQPASTRRTINKRPRGQVLALPWIFIRFSLALTA